MRYIYIRMIPQSHVLSLLMTQQTMWLMQNSNQRCMNMYYIYIQLYWIHLHQYYPTFARSFTALNQPKVAVYATRRGGGLGSSTIFKKFNEPYAPS